jgi:hypothetical protein
MSNISLLVKLQRIARPDEEFHKGRALPIKVVGLYRKFPIPPLPRRSVELKCCFGHALKPSMRTVRSRNPSSSGCSARPTASSPIRDVTTLGAVELFWHCHAFTSWATHPYFLLSPFMLCVCAYAHLRSTNSRQLRTANRSCSVHWPMAFLLVRWPTTSAATAPGAKQRQQP